MYTDKNLFFTKITVNINLHLNYDMLELYDTYK